MHDGPTIMFSLISKIPDVIIGELENHVRNISTVAAIAQFERASEIPANDGDHVGSANVLLDKVKFHSRQGKGDAALKEFMKLEKAW